MGSPGQEGHSLGKKAHGRWSGEIDTAQREAQGEEGGLVRNADQNPTTRHHLLLYGGGQVEQRSPMEEIGDHIRPRATILA